MAKQERAEPLAHIEAGKCDLVSRNGNTFHRFTEVARCLAKLRVESAVIDGEIACLDEHGRTLFNELMFHRRQCVFLAFDLLFINGEDLRGLPLIERKRRLKKLIGRRRVGLLYVSHIETNGSALFVQTCKLDLEEIVAKRKNSPYRATDKPSPHWVKIKNPEDSQKEGREELFER